MENIIALKNGFIIKHGGKHKNFILAMQVVSELMQLGHLPDQLAIDALSNYSVEELSGYYNEVIPHLKKLLGADRTYKPFWKGFPQEVMEKSEADLWLHQIIHYLSNGTYEPSELLNKRKSAFEHISYIPLTAKSYDDFDSIFTKLVGVNQSLTSSDVEIIKWFANSGRRLKLPNNIPFKENLAVLASFRLPLKLKSVTDVLRTAVAMSGGDTSLPKVPKKFIKDNVWYSTLSYNNERDKFKFKNFTRAERRYILSLLESSNCDVTEGVLKEGRWKRLGEKLHPTEYSSLFPKSAEFFFKIRNEKIQSWYGKAAKAIPTSKSLESGLRFLAERPGEYARRLDYFIRNYDEATVLKIFKDIGGTVSNKVLYELYTHFSKRTAKYQRSITVKNGRRKVYLPQLEPLTESTVNSVLGSIIDILRTNFSRLEPLGKVYLDENLKKLPLPTNMRALNAALKPKLRGERIPFGNLNTKVVRAYVHWFDNDGLEDIDLSATFIGDGKIDFISWNQGLKHSFGTHSGDVRYRVGSCAEYIDVDIKQALEAGFRYALLDVRNFTGKSLASVTDCVFGYMEREYPAANEIFVPATISNAVRLESPAATTLVAVLDLKSLEYIFLDIDSGSIPVASLDAANIMLMVEDYIKPPKFSVYDLLKLHVDSRGILVYNQDEADKVLSLKEFSDSYINTLKYMGV